VASPLDEGRTPWIYSGECQIGLTKFKDFTQFLTSIAYLLIERCDLVDS
jgi:hypothetical protein